MVHAVLDLLYLLRAQPRPHLPAPDPNFTFENRISLHQVCFRYAGSQVDSLHNLTFDIPIGQKIGVIGPSGAGKSTLVGVLSGLLYPRRGTILVDGTPLDPGRAAAFAQLIGYVPQQPFLFAGTLAENVAFSSWGRPWDKQRVMEACQRAAVDFITTHPDGVNQRIGENGAGLSGGQAQRISIARALYCRPKLLIFDEATSALDQANENHIQNTIDSLANEVTCVIIAHRLTTVENCDSIIWVDNGHLVMHDKTNIVLEKYKKEQLRV
jgi:ABC-type bacteriocin/lantibiotic exporter with double-glycine peptidase domain